ncbi:PAS domain S-box protein [Corallococcus sp. AB011P]|uniref:hybrid sensor histidine kinase/response regulator n=1 Tax=Corallococcus sp. AB011P TaxID=2316735 RepID=UPI000EA2F596|nr:ATP-binding protein [Corallococcus sp. AB011P]RKG50231.1 PAS domain S-box protein [Corallococcus sp. AB011P]
MSARGGAALDLTTLPSAERPLSILLLEDSPLDAQLVAAQLEEGGLPSKLECVQGRAAFVAALEKGKFDLILSDYNVPGFDGMSALEAAKAVCPDMPFLFVSGALGEDRAIELLKRGATDYVLKDRLERLGPSVRRALREAEGVRLRKRTEEALRRSEERYQLVAHASFDAIWDLDLQTDAMHWIGDATEEVFGFPVEEVGADAAWWRRHIHGEDRERVLAGLQRAFDSDEDRWQDEYRVLRKDGEYAYVAAQGSILRGESGKARRIVGAMRDITERRRAEEERQKLVHEAQARVEFEQQLIGIVSHDLRNPLGAILTGASLMLRRDDIQPWHAKAAARVLSAAERATRMIRDLLDFTQARMGGGIPVHAAPCDFHALTLQVVEEARTAHPERTLQMEQVGDGQGSWDSDRMAQVLSNILGNALKYSPEDTPVRVESRGEQDAVVVHVRNGGDPIPPEMLPRIFEPLQRGTTAGRSERSIGLGLYIVRQLVLAHGGTVDARSSAAEGTVFTVRLPRVPPREMTAPVPE